MGFPVIAELLYSPSAQLQKALEIIVVTYIRQPLLNIYYVLLHYIIFFQYSGSVLVISCTIVSVCMRLCTVYSWMVDRLFTSTSVSLLLHLSRVKAFQSVMDIMNCRKLTQSFSTVRMELVVLAAYLRNRQ